MSVLYGVGCAASLAAMSALLWLGWPNGDGSLIETTWRLLGILGSVTAASFCAVRLVHIRTGITDLVLVDLTAEDEARLDAWCDEMNRHNPSKVGRAEALRVLAMAYAKEHVGDLEPAP